jgi:predicted nucleotidyltransferase
VAELVTKGSNPGVRNALDRLVRQGTVIDRRSGSSILYVANRDHLAWPVIEFAVGTTDSALRTLTDRIGELTRQSLSEPDLSRTTLALFGSVARGSSSTSSDVDIVAVFPSGTPGPETEQLVDRIAADVQLRTGNTCNVYEVTEARLAQMIESGDPLIGSWKTQARIFLGPDLVERLGGA